VTFRGLAVRRSQKEAPMTRTLAAFSTIALLLTIPAHADDPDSEIDPTTGYIETVSQHWNGNDNDIRLTTDRTPLEPLSVDVCDGSTQDIGPRVAITSSGALWVVWTRDASIDQIHARGRESLGFWGDILLASYANENSRNPEVLVDGAAVRIVYEIAGTSTQSVAVVSLEDDPDPLTARTIVASTSSMGTLDTRIHREAGHLWITWVDDDDVAWSELASGSWASPSYEAIGGGGAAAARSEIRELVLSE